MKSILSLPPALQELWSRVYAATIASGRAELDEDTCERKAWEAVRRAKALEAAGQAHYNVARLNDENA